MTSILIVYATRDGHTRLIAQHIAERLRERGCLVELYDARDTGTQPRVTAFSGVLLATSLRMARHEKEMLRFIEREREALAARPTAFLSVSLSAAGAQDSTRPAEYRERVTHELEKCTNQLYDRTHWHPGRTEFVAGALMYTRYNPLVRWALRRIARKEGASTDTAHDHVLTDWKALDRFVDDFVATVEPVVAAAS
jgi:menaquinone-dependent protoporphyrinogen oxidase